MSLEDAELENDLFYVVTDAVRDSAQVLRRGLVEVRETDNAPTGREAPGMFVCECADLSWDYGGYELQNDLGDASQAAKQIAHALNRLPKLERMLIDVATAIKFGDQGRVNEIAAEIEELICG